jgi:hypothetical protein
MLPHIEKYDTSGKHLHPHRRRKSLRFITHLRIVLQKHPIQTTLIVSFLLLIVILICVVGILFPFSSSSPTAPVNPSISINDQDQSIRSPSIKSFKDQSLIVCPDVTCTDSTQDCNCETSTSEEISRSSSNRLSSLKPSSLSALIALASRSKSSKESLSAIAARSNDPLSIDRLVYGTEKQSLPTFIQSFREGHVDWHDLVPNRPNTGEPGLNFKLLVDDEHAITKQLMYESNRHNLWDWGSDFGPLKNYHLCPFVQDRCQIHGRTDCLANSLCGWCSNQNLCVDRFQGPRRTDSLGNPVCESLELGPQTQNPQCDSGKPIHLWNDGKKETLEYSELSKCQTIITDRVIFTTINSNAQAMFYHFLSEHLSPLYNSYFRQQNTPDFYTHFIAISGKYDQFYEFYGIFTRFCPHYPAEMKYNNLCMCTPRDTTPVNAEGVLPSTTSLQEHMLKVLELEDVHPPPDQPSVALISRQYKRFLLNEYEMVQAAHSLNISARLLPLEFMTLYEQIREFRRAKMLAGVHGSGLSNFMFLHPDTYSLQLLPYKLEGGSSFFTRFAQDSGSRYIEWKNTKKENSLFHSHFLSETDRNNINRVVEGGSSQSSQQTYFSFWINQDTVVDLDEWKELLKRYLLNG